MTPQMLRHERRMACRRSRGVVAWRRTEAARRPHGEKPAYEHAEAPRERRSEAAATRR